MAEPPFSPPNRAGRPASAAPPGTGDPSMEDILASIRRILNEDEPAPSVNPPPPPPPAADEPLDLTREMLVAAPPASSVPSASPLAPAATLLSPAEAVLPPAPPEPLAPVAPPSPAPSVESLLAPAAAAAASASMGSLLRAVAAERGSAVARSSGPTIEDVVREELRPLLKDWLDQHLPAVVERLVRAEIERVVGRALS